MKLILHNYMRCPFCIRVRILLALKKIPYEIIEEPLRVWTPWMKEWSDRTHERRRVPVLRYVLDEGVEKILPESNDINYFLDSMDGTPEYTPDVDSPAHNEMLAWFAWCAKELKPVLDLYKYGENRVFDREKNVFHIEALKGLFQKLEDALEGKEYLLEERLTLADIAIIPFIRQIMRTRQGEFDFTPYPRVLAWTKKLIESDWFLKEVMQNNDSV